MIIFLFIIFFTMIIIYIMRTYIRPRRIEEIDRIIDSGQTRLAIKKLTEIVEKDERNTYAHYLLALAYVKENNFKFAIIPNQVRQIKFVKTEKFSKVFYALYLNVFFDAGYGVYNQDFGQETNDLQNTLLFGYGAGLDFVTYYDIVVRFEFSVNIMNETGFFLHFIAPI